MSFPRDPNAPDGPRRSEFVRASVAARSGSDHPAEAEVSVRLSTVEGDDGEWLRRLASLHDRPAPRGPVVLAEVEGTPVAALSLADGEAVADPARSSSGILALLHLHRLETRLIAAVWGV
jgi:hypothetical protein